MAMKKNWTSIPGIYWSPDTREFFVVYSDESIWIPTGWMPAKLDEVHDEVMFFTEQRKVDDARMVRIGDIPETMRDGG